MRKDDDFDDLIWYEAGLDEDGFDYWVLFSERERAEREARKARKQRRRVDTQPQGTLTAPVAAFFILLGFILVAIAGR